MNWREIVNLSDGDLINKGVAALGARRKMLKVFEQVRKEMLLQVNTHTYTHTKKKSHLLWFSPCGTPVNPFFFFA